VDSFVVPTVMFKVLFVFVVLVHDRRRVVHSNVTDAPTAQWTAQQLVEAFPWKTAPRYLLRDRDAVYGVVFSSRAQAMGIHEVKTAPRSPWQNQYVERLIGTLRRECLDHVVVLNDAHLRRLLRNYLTYYHGCRTHLSLEKDAPDPRPVEHPDQGGIVEIPMVGGLHHRYTRPGGVRSFRPASCAATRKSPVGRSTRFLGLPPPCVCGSTGGCPSEPRPNYFNERPHPVLRIPGWVKRKAQPARGAENPVGRLPGLSGLPYAATAPRFSAARDLRREGGSVPAALPGSG
jgi:putative transposase